MKHDDDRLVFLSNVIWNLYRATLHGEMSKETFFKVKEIVRRAVTPEDLFINEFTKQKGENET